MKKSDFAAFIVYIAMFALALLVGLFVIRGAISDWGIQNSILVVVLSIMVGVVFNALLLELGHLLGAKAGGYLISMWSVLGLTFKKQKDGKFHFSLSGFEGLTGETKVVPKDIKKSSLSAYIAFPLLGYLLEVIAGVVLMAWANREHVVNSSNKLGWLYIGSIVAITIGGMIYFYNIFPARVDAVTDGYRMTFLNKAINRQAYNQLLIADDKKRLGLPLGEAPIYDDVTDFTAALNTKAVYEAIDKENYRGAIQIVQKSLDSVEHLSQSTKDEAMAMKLSLVLLTTRREDGETYYQGIDNNQRKYIASFPDIVALRCYILISGIIENSLNETNYGLDKVEKLLKRVDEDHKKTEMNLINLSLTRIRLLHPDWKLDYDSDKQEPTK